MFASWAPTNRLRTPPRRRATRSRSPVSLYLRRALLHQHGTRAEHRCAEVQPLEAELGQRDEAQSVHVRRSAGRRQQQGRGLRAGLRSHEGRNWRDEEDRGRLGLPTGADWPHVRFGDFSCPKGSVTRSMMTIMTQLLSLERDLLHKKMTHPSACSDTSVLKQTTYLKKKSRLRYYFYHRFDSAWGVVRLLRCVFAS